MAAKKSVSLHPSKPEKAAAAPLATSDRVSVTHGAYLVVAGRRGDSCAAVGYLGNRRIEARTADTVEAAVDAVKGALDDRVSGLKAGRSSEVPSEAEFREALVALHAKLPKRMQAMLATHCRLPGSAASLTDLARRFEVSVNTAKIDYGKLARQLAKLLDFAPAEATVERGLLPLLTVATLSFSEGKPAVLHLRPELVGALRTLQQIEA
jgi:hypothetical protein